MGGEERKMTQEEKEYFCTKDDLKFIVEITVEICGAKKYLACFEIKNNMLWSTYVDKNVLDFLIKDVDWGDKE